MKEFNGLDYTRGAIAEEVSLIERHARDGSAVQGGCACIEEKHLLLLAGLSSEGVTLATDPAEKDYYMKLADWARKTRLEIITGEFQHAGNPRTRAYLPHGLTDCEKTHASVRKALASCIKQAEIKCCGVHTKDYSQCTCNPVAVCRASVPCP